MDAKGIPLALEPVKTEGRMATEQQLPKLAGKLTEHQKFFSELSTEDAQWMILNPQAAIKKIVTSISNHREAHEIMSLENEIVKLHSVSKKESLIIDACDGTETFRKADDFYIPSGEEENATDGFVMPTEENVADVYTIQATPVSVQDFRSFGVSLINLCFTEHQILNFYRKHCFKLGDWGSICMFLYYHNHDLCVAGIHGKPGEENLCIHPRKFRESEHLCDWICSDYSTGFWIIPRFRA